MAGLLNAAPPSHSRPPKVDLYNIVVSSTFFVTIIIDHLKMVLDILKLIICHNVALSVVTREYVITFLHYEAVTSFDIATCPSNTMHFVKHVGAVLSQTSECFHSFSFFSSNTEYEHEEFHSSPVRQYFVTPFDFKMR